MNNEEWLIRLPLMNCPTCGHTLNAILDGNIICAQPDEGDISICIECYTPLIFNKDLSLRLLTLYEKEELGELISDATIRLAFLKRDHL